MGRPRTDSVVVDGAELVAVLAGSRAAGIAGMVRRPEGRGGGYWGEELGLGFVGDEGVREEQHGPGLLHLTTRGGGSREESSVRHGGMARQCVHWRHSEEDAHFAKNPPGD